MNKLKTFDTTSRLLIQEAFMIQSRANTSGHVDVEVRRFLQQ